MGQNSSIEWTESTWNPVTGCTKVSPGCANCYAERMALRLKAMGQVNYAKGFDVALHEKALELPLRWKTPQTIFVNSMSDLFHHDIPSDFIKRVFRVMNKASHHRFQLLTKRSERLKDFSKSVIWTKNIWAGVSVETAEYLYRMDDLRSLPAAVKFVSMEPLLGMVSDMNLSNIEWIIAGGESGPGARPLRPEWVRCIRDQCKASHVPFFFKQWGGTRKKKAGRELDGKIYSEMPIAS